MPDLLQVDDVAALPQTPRRSYLAAADLAAATRELNEAFDMYACWAAGQHRRAAHGEVRQWFSQMAGQARGLLCALGHDRSPLADHGFLETLTHLIVAKPHPDGGGPREQDAQHKMETLARRAMPEAYAQAEREGSIDPGWTIANASLNKRLKATLELLELLATRGAAVHESLVSHGGRAPELARDVLFCELARIYQRLFGCLPGAPSHTATRAEQDAFSGRESLPKGPALNWHRALLALIDTRASALLPPTGDGLDSERAKVLCECVALARVAAKEKTGDGLAHWIRRAAAACAKNPQPISI